MPTRVNEITALRGRVKVLEQQLLECQGADAELQSLYWSQEVFMQVHKVSWCDTPFAGRIKDLEEELGY